ELPHFYAALEDQLAAWDRFELPSFVRVGSWIGGDCDGNPFVTAEMLRQALGMQSERALKFYLDEVHLLGGELSLDGRLVTVSDQLRNLAECSPDRSPRRRHEPYRLAVSGIYARLAATARTFKQAEVSRHAVGEAPPYADAAEFAADLGILYHSLTAKAKKAVARSRAPRAGGRCGRLRGGRHSSSQGKPSRTAPPPCAHAPRNSGADRCPRDGSRKCWPRDAGCAADHAPASQSRFSYATPRRRP